MKTLAAHFTRHDIFNSVPFVKWILNGLSSIFIFKAKCPISDGKHDKLFFDKFNSFKFGISAIL